MLRGAILGMRWAKYMILLGLDCIAIQSIGWQRAENSKDVYIFSLA